MPEPNDERSLGVPRGGPPLLAGRSRALSAAGVRRADRAPLGMALPLVEVAMISPVEFLKQVINRWEGGYQSYADDAGNWVTRPDGMRIKIGTMRGVTPSALAAHRGVSASTLTPADMQSV